MAAGPPRAHGLAAYGPRPELRAAHVTSPEQPSATRSRSASADSPGEATASRSVAAMLPAPRNAEASPLTGRWADFAEHPADKSIAGQLPCPSSPLTSREARHAGTTAGLLRGTDTSSADPASPTPGTARRTRPAPHVRASAPDGKRRAWPTCRRHPRTVPLWTAGVDPREPYAARQNGRFAGRPVRCRSGWAQNSAAVTLLPTWLGLLLPGA